MTEYAPTLVGDDPPPGGFAEGTIVGSDPLEVKDGDTAYIETSFSAGTLVSFRLPANASASATARVWVSVDAKELTAGAGVVVQAEPAGAGGSAPLIPGSIHEITTDYTTVTKEVDFTVLSPEFAPNLLISPDTVWHVTGNVRTTWLRIIVEGDVWLRNWPRPDGLSAGNAPRNWPTPTVARSIRGYGAVP